MKRNGKKIVHYDKEADVLALYLGGGGEEESRELAPGVVAEFDKEGQIIGIEVLNASRVFKSFLESARRKVPVEMR